MERDRNHLTVNVTDMLRIAECVEEGVADFYARAAQCVADTFLSSLCKELAERHRGQAVRWAQHRHALMPHLPTQPMGELRDRLVTPEAMVSLTWLGRQRLDTDTQNTQRDRTSFLRGAQRRAHDLITFYQGLKGFAQDERSEEVLEQILGAQLASASELESRSMCDLLSATPSYLN